ncbi:response regulator transcription factor [Paenibacillus oceani]|uniref:Response regulator transcription factor n=1 Tax=Paenibacillus oceani TaxID=2772510 RepID=A0A927CE41_9BACL|nr:response regulator transcription factor [Paenibacillus oceani]MBD2864922.1 response regulator transcription factor [Paenibacillus oceani]
MVKLMIVDDESIIRKGIRTSIDWWKLDVDIVGEARNGKEALELCEQLKPDIVVTDIRMPHMDGLELARQLKERVPQTKIVIISGYDDFDYARQALKIGVNEYLMKPVGATELEALITKISEEIARERKKIEEEQSNLELIRENFPFIQRKWVNRLLKGANTDAAVLFEQAGQLNISLEGPEYAALVVDVDDFRLITEHASDRDKELTLYAIANITEEVLSSVFACTVCQSDFDYINLFVNANMKNKHRLIECCEEIQRCVARYMKLSVTIGAGAYVRELKDLHKSSAQAVFAMQSKVYRGKGQIIVYGETETGDESKRKLLPPSENDKELLQNLSVMDQTKIDALLDERFLQFAHSHVPYEHIKALCLKWVILAMAHLEQMGVNLGESQLAALNPYEEIEKYETTEDIRRWLGDLFAAFIESIAAYKNVRFKHIVTAAIKYIQEHYAEDIRLEDVSSQVFVTPNYFSRVFKEETGQHFTEWLNTYRVDKAKVLLKDVGTKIYEVAERVGYNDYKYFTHVFKKYTGFTPKEYRNRL